MNRKVICPDQLCTCVWCRSVKLFEPGPCHTPLRSKRDAQVFFKDFFEIVFLCLLNKVPCIILDNRTRALSSLGSYVGLS